MAPVCDSVTSPWRKIGGAKNGPPPAVSASRAVSTFTPPPSSAVRRATSTYGAPAASSASRTNSPRPWIEGQ